MYKIGTVSVEHVRGNKVLKKETADIVEINGHFLVFFPSMETKIGDSLTIPRQRFKINGDGRISLDRRKNKS